MNHKKRHPESEMMSYGYEPLWSEGSIKAPIFQTSTFVFRTAEEGKSYFELAYGLRDPREGEVAGLIYSRLNHPNMEILENRLALWEEAEAASVHDSGMAAISTAVFTFLKPGQVILHGYPLYGGTAHFFSEVLPQFQIETIPFMADQSWEEITDMLNEKGVSQDKVGMIFLETPANPTNELFDIERIVHWRDKSHQGGSKAILAVDNTYMGPLWQQPIRLGADLSIYSATKYLGGHSDLIAGAILGSAEKIQQIKTYRTFFGNAPSPNTCWLLMRSLETLKVRMEAQQAHAQTVADFLSESPHVKKVSYIGLNQNLDARQSEIYKKQMSGPGAMISFDLEGGEAEAFAFLNQLRLVKMAVSLGSTESLAQNPYSMTHAAMPDQEKQKLGIHPSGIRLSVGLENPLDLIADIQQAMNVVYSTSKV